MMSSHLDSLFPPWLFPTANPFSRSIINTSFSNLSVFGGLDPVPLNPQPTKSIGEVTGAEQELSNG